MAAVDVTCTPSVTIAGTVTVPPSLSVMVPVKFRTRGVTWSPVAFVHSIVMVSSTRPRRRR